MEVNKAHNHAQCVLVQPLPRERHARRRAPEARVRDARQRQRVLGHTVPVLSPLGSSKSANQLCQCADDEDHSSGDLKY